LVYSQGRGAPLKFAEFTAANSSHGTRIRIDSYENDWLHPGPSIHIGKTSRVLSPFSNETAKKNWVRFSAKVIKSPMKLRRRYSGFTLKYLRRSFDQKATISTA
jgi:hypothetical protein